MCVQVFTCGIPLTLVKPFHANLIAISITGKSFLKRCYFYSAIYLQTSLASSQVNHPCQITIKT